MTDSDSNHPKTILFLCKCGTHVSNFVDFDPVVDWAREKKNVNIVAISNLLCAPQGKEFFKEIISDVAHEKVKSIVIAGCSPKMHEKTFQELVEAKGINISKVTMANIREQCAWVTKDKGEATKKAIAMINAAIKRSYLSENLERQKMTVETDVCIIGGGIAGMKAAQTLARAGRKVYLIERNISLGGAVIKTEEVAPHMECSPCLLAPVLSDIRDDSNIEVITNAQVEEVLGFFGNFTVKVNKKARFIKENCIGCEECFKVCPVDVPSDFHEGLGTRKAVYTLFPGSVPQAAVIDKENCLYFKDKSCDKCVSSCPFQSVDFEEKDEELLLKAGAIITATGFQSYDISNIEELGHKKIENVYTTPEFERLASSNGPTGGKIVLANGNVPSSIAVVHCAGSLREDHVPYCSKICCLNALKVGELARKVNPEIKVYNIHNDLVFTSPGEHDFHKRQKEGGTEFIRCSNLQSIKINPGNEGKIKVAADGMSLTEVDMVVLSTGLKPALGTTELAEMLNVDLTQEGYFQSDHSLLHSTGATLDGVYIAGCAVKPADVASSTTQGQAVAGDALSKLVPGREIELEMFTSSILEDVCAGCKLCIISCPYKAISFNEEKSISVINEAICRGCGTCVVSCPSGAALAKHFTDEQINAEIGGLLNV